MKSIAAVTSSPRLEDLYSSITEFESTLEDARMNARTDWEESFVKQAKEKYAEFSGRMFWTEKQDDILRKIAGPDD